MIHKYINKTNCTMKKTILDKVTSVCTNPNCGHVLDKIYYDIDNTNTNFNFAYHKPPYVNKLLIKPINLKLFHDSPHNKPTQPAK